MDKISKDSAVTLVELPPTLFGVLDGDAGFDIYSQSRLPSRAIHALQAILLERGWSDVETINPIYHGENKRLSEDNWRRIMHSDLLLTSAITRTSPQTDELVRKYKTVRPDGIAISGGMHPTFQYEETLRNGTDIVVRLEGEQTLRELSDALIGTKGAIPGSSRADYAGAIKDVLGIAYRDGTDIVVNPDRPLLSAEELSALPFPHYDDATKHGIRTRVSETSRGCPWDCDFCVVTNVYGRTYRKKHESRVAAALREAQGMGVTTFFIDDNLAADPRRTIKLLDELDESGIDLGWGQAQVSVQLAKYPETLERMRKSITVLYVGIESIIDETLAGFHKPASARENMRAVQAFHDHGFWVHGMMMVGGDGDTPEALREISSWANKNLDSVQFFAPVPFPGTRFSDAMKDRILTRDYSLYDAQNVIVRPRHMTPYALQMGIIRMYEDFYSYKNTLRRLPRSPDKG